VTRRLRVLRACVALALPAIALATLPAGAAAQAHVTATPSSLRFGDATTITGILADPVGAPRAGVMAELQPSPFPYHGFVDGAHATTAADGSFAFPNVRPDRNTRYRVIEWGAVPTAASGAVTVYVAPRGLVRSHKLGPGRVWLKLEIRHSRHFRWRGQRVFWYVRPSDAREFTLVARTRAREPRRGLTTASTVVGPPARRFLLRACLQPADLLGAGPPATKARCSRRDFVPGRSPSGLAFDGEARGELAVPGPAAVAAALGYLRGRAGRTAFAVVDSGGTVRGSHLHRRFSSASVVKAMLLVGYLRRLSERGAGLDAGSRARLYPMIHVSDNNAASAIFAVVGQAGLWRVARVAAMTDFASSPIWGATRISAADQARFFYDQDSLVPRGFRRYARGLLSGIAREQSWGVPAVARPRYAVFFKGGWNPVRGIVNQVARLERHGHRIAIAMLQDGTPSMGYGEETIAGVTRRLLAR
jgi:hypothetical protein